MLWVIYIAQVGRFRARRETLQIDSAKSVNDKNEAIDFAAKRFNVPKHILLAIPASEKDMN